MGLPPSAAPAGRTTVLGLPGRGRKPLVERVALWSARHRKTAVFAWLALVAAAFIAGQFGGGGSVKQYDPGQAGQGERTLASLGVVTPPRESVLIQPRAAAHLPAAAAAAEVSKATAEVRNDLAALPKAAASIGGPFRGSRGAALVTFTVAGPHAAAQQTVLTDLAAVQRVQSRHPDLMVQEAGQASTSQAANSVLGKDFRKSEWTSIPLTLILLVAVFGALIAAGIPVLLAATAVIMAVSLLGIASHWFPVGSGTSELVLVIGMAVGVDYSLFYLRREREERMAGHDDQAVVGLAAATSGRAILVSGLTVMVSLGGLFLTGIDMFTGIAFGTILVVGMAVLGSLFFLPALLAWLGPWADRLQLPYLGSRRTHPQPSRLWTRLANPQVDLPSSLPIVHVLADIQHEFPARPAPAEVVISGSGLDSPAMHRALSALGAESSRRGSAASPAISGPVSASLVAGGRALVVQVPLAGNGTSAVSTNALLTLENRILPATVGTVPGASFAVTGNTAANHDLRSMLHTRTPIVFGVVALLAFLLLMLAFRSLAIPLVSIALNFLSVGGAYGLVTLIFQDGHLQSLLGFNSFGALVPWVPLFTFVMLFGLSMDYHVFIISRIRELWSGGATALDAVVGGVSRSAGVVSSAAVIMVAVFSIFATLDMIDVKMLGVGLAAAVVIDATLVRGIVLPAALALLGERAWYLPSWLHWLPGRSLVCEHTPLRRHARLPLPAPHVPAGIRVPVGVGSTP